MICPLASVRPASGPGTGGPWTRAGWNTVGNLIEFVWLRKACHRPHFAGMRVKNGGVQFQRIRDFRRYYFNSIPPTSRGGPWGRPPEVVPASASVKSQDNYIHFVCEKSGLLNKYIISVSNKAP